jgi:hypothetical protein
LLNPHEEDFVQSIATKDRWQLLRSRSGLEQPQTKKKNKKKVGKVFTRIQKQTIKSLSSRWVQLKYWSITSGMARDVAEEEEELMILQVMGSNLLCCCCCCCCH